MTTEPQYHVARLHENGGQVDPVILGKVFRAPWRSIELVRLGAGQQLGPRSLGDSEAMAFVTEGVGTAQLHSQRVELRPGVALTLFKDELLDVTAGGGTLEFFFAEMGEST